MGCWHLPSSPCQQHFTMRDHEGMCLQHLRFFPSSVDTVYAVGDTVARKKARGRRPEDKTHANMMIQDEEEEEEYDDDDDDADADADER